MSLVPLLVAVVLLLTTAWAQQPPLYTYLGEPYCTNGYSLINGRCYPRWHYPSNNPRWPEVDRPRDPNEAHNLIVPSTDEICPEGYKKSRGQCSKLTEREIELDRLPKEPCPEGQRKSRLVCRNFHN